ncbi:MAG: hypothetical protein RB296_07430 [Acidobacteriota bacterium]|jgi:hypothetical protein|nr:hypothetical protein [Acidobacteriota bacterium]
MARQIRPAQRYSERLLKLIPSEIIAAWVAVQGIIPRDSGPWVITAAAVLLMVLTPIYLKRFQGVSRPMQLVASTGSFLVWVYTLGGPFVYWGIYFSWLASVLLILWTVTVPLFLDGEDRQAA